MNIEVSVKDNSKLDYDLNTDLQGEVTLAEFLTFTKKALLQISLDTLREEQAKGFDKNPITIVDGSKSKSIETVSPLGKIEFVNSQVQSLKVLEDIYQAILSRSKVVTGTYMAGNYVFLNGNVIATNLSEMQDWLKTSPSLGKGDIVRYINVVPYARRLERLGVTAQKTQSRRVKSKDKRKRSGETILGANGVYYLSSRAALRQYRNNVKIYFGFILGSQISAGAFPSMSKSGKPLRRSYKPPAGKKPSKKFGPYLYPSIKVVFEERGTVNV